MTRRVDLSQPDNSALVRGRPVWVEVLWQLIGQPIVDSRLLPFSILKVATLRCFGARVGKGVLVKPGVRVKFPWYLEVGDHCWIGEDVWIDNLAEVRIGSHVCISQGAYLCTGNHDWKAPNMKLFRRPITLADGCWVGARSLVCPGVSLGAGSVLTAGSVGTRSLGEWEIHGGNPATYLRRRRLGDPSRGPAEQGSAE